MFYIIGGGAGISYSKTILKNYDDSNAKNSMALTTITYSNKSCKCENSDRSIIKKMMSLSLPLGKYTGVYIWQNTKKRISVQKLPWFQP
jgi:hypothetical protein